MNLSHCCKTDDWFFKIDRKYTHEWQKLLHPLIFSKLHTNIFTQQVTLHWSQNQCQGVIYCKDTSVIIYRLSCSCLYFRKENGGVIVCPFGNIQHNTQQLNCRVSTLSFWPLGQNTINILHAHKPSIIFWSRTSILFVCLLSILNLTTRRGIAERETVEDTRKSWSELFQQLMNDTSAPPLSHLESRTKKTYEEKHSFSMTETYIHYLTDLYPMVFSRSANAHL